MSKIVTRAELLEIVPDLRAMAASEAAPEVRRALHRLADRYAAMISRAAPLAIWAPTRPLKAHEPIFTEALATFA